jgi:hypothetical protein
MVVRNDDAKVLDVLLLKIALVVSQIELVLLHALQDDATDATMFLFGLGEDEDVVDVDAYDALENQILEDLVHHGLERHRGVGQSEVHDKGFKEPAIGAKRGLPLVAFLYLHIVVTPLHIQLREVPCAAKAMD